MAKQMPPCAATDLSYWLWAASQTMINISAESGFVWFEKLVQTAHTRIQYTYTTEPLTDHKSNSLCWLHSQFAIEVRTNCMICNFVSSIVRGCIPRMLTRLARQSTPLFPANSAQSFDRPHVVLAQIIRIFVAGCPQWRGRDSGKNYCLAFLFAFYCCHLPPIVLPALHSLFHFFVLFYCYVIKFLARGSSTVRFDESLSCSSSCSASPLSLCCLNARQIAAVRLLFRP